MNRKEIEFDGSVDLTTTESAIDSQEWIEILQCLLISYAKKT